MSVYKEAYRAIETIQTESRRLYHDACDYGALCNKGDKLWNLSTQLVKDYGVKDSRKESNYLTGSSVTNMIEVIDEWAVSDERKTVSEATECYLLEYTTTRNDNYDGFLNISLITK